MILTSTALDVDEFERRTGWAIKPQGACKGEMCIPLDGTDALSVADRLGMALVHDERAGLWALGPDTAGGRALSTTEMPDLVLADATGSPFALRSLRGQKIFLLAWASW